MNKQQRDYAIKRVTGIIKKAAKYPTPPTAPTYEDISKIIGIEVTKDTYGAYHVKAFLEKLHPAFENFRRASEDYSIARAAVDKEVEKAVQEAADFIYLGDTKEVLEYIRSFDAS